MNDLLTQLLQKLDEPAARYSMLDNYYAGESPLAYLAPAAAEALGNRLRKVSVNIPRLLVDSVARTVEGDRIYRCKHFRRLVEVRPRSDFADRAPGGPDPRLVVGDCLGGSARPALGVD